MVTGITKTKVVLYIGGFILPNGNAAAQRVVSNAKALKVLGYEVIMLNECSEVKKDSIEIREYYGFKCIEIYKSKRNIDLLKKMISIDNVLHAINLIGTVDIIIAYNYPAIALERILRFGRKKGIKFVGDITEWYSVKGHNILYKIVKGLDSCLRMRIVNKKMDGLIVISRYLEKYYKNQLTVRLPPLIDADDKKWNIGTLKKELKKVNFIYAGSPSSIKERLDVIVLAIEKLAEKYPLRLYIVGIGKNEFQSIYKKNSKASLIEPNAVSFLGRLSHEETIKNVIEADYSIIIRDNNRVTRAGFPTKFVESVACGTPVIFNDNSDLIEYQQCGYLVSVDNLETDLEKIIKIKDKPKIEKFLFDYRNYLEALKNFLILLGQDNEI